MKKVLSALCLVFLTLSLVTGCGNNITQLDDNTSIPQKSSVPATSNNDNGISESDDDNPDLQESSEKEVGEVAAVELPPEVKNSDTPENSLKPDESVDVDLTVLSSTMIYAEVYNIMATPDDYIGKTIKMRGPYYASYYDDTEQYYHYVIISDAAACCAQGMEFVWNGDHVYPDDYPEDNTIVEVVGVFGEYEELGVKYVYLAVDDLMVI